MGKAVESNQDSFPLSLTQEDIYFDQLHFGDSPLYNVGGCIRLARCDVERLQAAHARIVEHNDVFGLRIRSADGQVRQEISAQRTTALPLLDLSSQSDPEAAATARLDALFQEPLPLEDAELFRAFVIRLDDDRYWYVCLAHHLMMDGWGFANLARTLGEAYHDTALQPTRPWRDVVAADAAYLASDRYAADRAYWLDHCGSTPEKLLAPFYDARFKATTRIPSGREVVALDPGEYEAVRAFAASAGVGVPQVLLGVLVAYFCQAYERDRVIVGVPAHNRRDHAEKQMLGAFTSVSPVCVDAPGELSFDALLRALRDTQRRSFRHQRYPIGHLIRDLGLTGRNNTLYDVGFNYLKLNSHFHVAGEQASLVYWTHFHEATPLILTVWEYGDDLPVELQFDYNHAYFEAPEAARIAQRFLRLLRTVLAGADASPLLSALPRLTEAEEQSLRAAVPEPPAGAAAPTVHALFEAQVRRAPEAIAVVGLDEALSYAELNQRANRLARHLRSQGVAQSAFVAICLRRSPELLVAVLAVLKSGAAYVPLDPDYPPSRLEHMLADCGAALLLTEADAGVLASQEQVLRIALDDPAVRAAVAAQPGHNLDALAGFTPETLAYLMYTSGSTGLPKGVMVSHANLKSYCAAVNLHYGNGPADATLQIASCSFDIFVEEVFTCLLFGGRLVLRPADIMDGGATFWRFVQEHKISFMGLSTAFWHSLCAGLEPEQPPADCLRMVSVGGEAMSGAMLKRWRDCFGDAVSVLNSYGPTECTVVATMFDTARLAPEQGAVPIGEPLQNTRCYVLDAAGRPVPPGVPGELYLSGSGVAQGYLNRPELTAGAFVANPFAGAGARMYRTGDLVRETADGGLDFFGRADKQLKIRGFRVEPSEVEAALLERAEVREAFVCARGEPRELVAYVVTAQVLDSVAELKAHLKRTLPDYMVPAAIVRIAALPFNANGKIDTARLPVPGREDYIVNAYVAPRHDLESALARIWAQVLKRERVGVEDHFFEIGGSSLIAAELQRAVNAELGSALKVTDIFAFPTVGDMAARIAGGDSAAPEPVEPLAERPASARADIAVVAMACRFPDADSPEAYWANLCSGKESVQFYTDAQLREAGVAAELLARPNYVKAGFVLDAVDSFDAAFFGFTPREAELLDPQQRLLFECAEEALACGGYGQRARQNRIGVFVGVGQNRYLFQQILPNRELIEQFGETAVMMANLGDFAATRLSHKLDLRGPSINVSTACSSSLVAVHMACASLRDGSSDLALAGGASIAMFRPTGVLADEGGIASADGHCRPFDAGADGTRPGSGAGVVLLKRLDDALAADDVVLAVIKGSAINNDGANKVGFTAPSVDGQVAVIREALAAGGLPATAVSYIEAHGTGTRLGDAIEVAALRKVFPAREQPYCAMGSVKSNVGHLDAAAGIAGFIKVVMALRHGRLPGQILFERPNPDIELDGAPFFVSREPLEWTYGAAPRTAGVSSFGIGGTNAHVVLQQAPACASHLSHREEQLVLLSARTESALKRYRLRLAHYLQAHPQRSLADVAYTLQLGREPLPCRFATVVNSIDALCEALNGEDMAAVATPPASVPDVVWLFPGDVAVPADWAADIYRQEPAFRAALDRCAELLEPELGLDLRELLQDDDEAAAPARRLAREQAREPLAFALGFSLAKLLRAWGLEPARLLGHGVGEYVAACIAGVLELPAALQLSLARAQLQRRLRCDVLLSIASAEAPIQALLQASGCETSAAGGESHCVAAGTSAQIAQLQALLAQQGIAALPLDASQAARLSWDDASNDAFTAVVAAMPRATPALAYAAVGADAVSATQIADPAYWLQQARQSAAPSPAALQSGLDAGSLCLELGAGSALSAALRRSGRNVHTLAATQAGRSEGGEQALLTALGQLWLAGVGFDQTAFFAAETRRKVVLPPHPFERRRYWIDTPAPRATLAPLSGPELHVPVWQREESSSTHAGAAEDWLIVGGDELACDIARLLDAHGQRAVVAGSRDATTTVGAVLRKLDIGSAADCRRLVEALGLESRSPQRVVICAAAAAAATPATGAAARCADLFTAAANLIRAVAAASAGARVRIDVVTRNAQSVTGLERLDTDCAVLTGLCKVAPQEYPWLECRQIDLDDTPAGLPRLIDELLSPGLAGEEVAYRGACRWVKSFVPHKAAAAACPSLLREQGVYLITGGIGNIGLAIAGLLAREYRARIALVGRSAAERHASWSADGYQPSVRTRHKIAALAELDRLGAEVIVLSADVADAAQMEAVFARVEQCFGPVHGVFHCAGEVDGAVTALQEIRREHAAAQFAPKVTGVQVLEQVLGRRRYDFCLLMSSLSAVLGGLGFAAYAAANAFLDAFVNARRNQGDLRWTAVNWDGWSFATDEALDFDRYRFGMAPEIGVRVLDEALRKGCPAQLVNSNGPLAQRLRDWVQSAVDEAAEPAPVAVRPPALAADFVPPRFQLETELAALWQQFLGFQSIGIDDDFFSLGGDSLLLTRVVAEINRRWNVELPIRTAFERPTIAGLAVSLAGLARVEDVSQKDDNLVEELL